MEVILKGKGTRVNLTQNDFLASGGEGHIYIKSGVAYKIYIDPKKMIPVDKIRELNSLSLTNIIKPKDVLLDLKNNPIGYTMDQVKDSIPLCQTFTKGYRTRNNLSPDDMIRLVISMRDGYKHIHQNKCLVVDGNEMNFLVDKDYKEVLFIDVDSYQTKSFHATALMESIRDRHTQGFNELTDWFAFAIVSFQMLIGIHPYKGKHPSLKTIEDRMQSNISVFNSVVDIPSQCYSFDTIPSNLRSWYEKVFLGERSLPPNNFDGPIIIVVTNKVINKSNFKFIDIGTYKEDIIGVYNDVVVTSNNVYHSGRFQSLNNVICGLTPKMNNKIGFTKKPNNTIEVYNISTQKNIGNIPGTDTFSYNDRVYIRSGVNILEVNYLEVPNNTIALPKVVAKILENSSQILDSVIIQNMLGTYYISIFPESGVHQQIRIPELDEYRIIDAKFDNNVLVVIGNKNGKFDKFRFRFSIDYKTYDIELTEDISYSGINFITLSSGICIMINESDEVEIFSNKIASNNKKIISDPSVTGSGKLYKHGTDVLYTQGNKLSKISLS